MADRVYPSAKPNPPPAAAATNGGATATSSFPAPKPQMYQRPIYRPPAPGKRRRGRSSSCRCNFCCCFCWSLLVVLLLALLAAVAGGAFYLLYRPQRPSFTVSAVRLAKLNVTTAPTTATTVLTSAVTLTVTARNPNKKVVYLYDDFTLSASTSANGVPLGTATVPAFVHLAGNTTVLSATLAADGVAVDPTAAASDIKRSGSFAVALDAETRAGVRVGSIKTKRIGIQVHCEGIKVTPPAPPKKPVVTVKLTKTKGKKANSTALHAPAPAPSPSVDIATTPAPAPASDDDTATPAAATVSAHSCTVRVRVKIWRWTF